MDYLRSLILEILLISILRIIIRGRTNAWFLIVIHLMMMTLTKICRLMIRFYWSRLTKTLNINRMVQFNTLVILLVIRLIFQFLVLFLLRIYRLSWIISLMCSLILLPLRLFNITRFLRILGRLLLRRILRLIVNIWIRRLRIMWRFSGTCLVRFISGLLQRLILKCLSFWWTRVNLWWADILFHFNMLKKTFPEWQWLFSISSLSWFIIYVHFIYNWNKSEKESLQSSRPSNLIIGRTY